MKKIMKSGIVLLLGFILFACSSSSFELKKDVFTFEYGETISIKAKDYIKAEKEVVQKTKITVDIKPSKKGAKISDKKGNDIVLTDLEVGTYKAKATYKKEVEKFEIQVKDTKKPAFIDFMSEINIEQNAEAVDFTKYFKAVDKIGEKEVTSSIEVNSENVDLTKLGTYEIKVLAKDENDNKISKKCKVHVISLEDASIENKVTKTLDGIVYQSKAMKDKIAAEEAARKAEEERIRQEQQMQQTNPGNTNQNQQPSGGNSNSGNNGNSGGGNPYGNGHYDRTFTKGDLITYFCDHTGEAWNTLGERWNFLEDGYFD